MHHALLHPIFGISCLAPAAGAHTMNPPTPKWTAALQFKTLSCKEIAGKLGIFFLNISIFEA